LLCLSLTLLTCRDRRRLTMFVTDSAHMSWPSKACYVCHWLCSHVVAVEGVLCLSLTLLTRLGRRRLAMFVTDSAHMSWPSKAYYVCHWLCSHVVAVEGLLCLSLTLLICRGRRRLAIFVTAVTSNSLRKSYQSLLYRIHTTLPPLTASKMFPNTYHSKTLNNPSVFSVKHHVFQAHNNAVIISVKK
jgi:hypothetical protein